MTDEQFEKFLAVQVAQLAMLQNISRNVQASIMNTGKPGTHHWGDIEKDILNAIAVIKKL